MFPDVFFKQSAILAFLFCFGFSLKKKSCRKSKYLQSTFDRIIDVYIIDVVENLGYHVTYFVTD